MQHIQTDMNLLQDSSIFAVWTPGQSSEVHSTVSQSHAKPDLKTFIAKSESPHEYPDKCQTNINVAMSDRLRYATPANKSDSPLSKKSSLFNFCCRTGTDFRRSDNLNTTK